MQLRVSRTISAVAFALVFYGLKVRTPPREQADFEGADLSPGLPRSSVDERGYQ